jgi:hypothetical protein
MQGKVAYIRPKAIRPFPGTYASRSYMHQVALYCYKLYSLEIVKKAITLKRCTSCRYTKTTTRRQPLKRIKKLQYWDGIYHMKYITFFMQSKISVVSIKGPFGRASLEVILTRSDYVAESDSLG